MLKTIITACLMSAIHAQACAQHAAEAQKFPSFPKKETQEAKLIRGENVFKRYCVLCHGVEGKGDGRAAKRYDPPPVNLTQSPYPVEYKEMVVRRGGEAMGRSPFMPPWEQELTDEQIADLMLFVQSLVK